MDLTKEFIQKLTELKSGDLGLLRTYAGKGLDEAVGAFDLFTGLWWPLREKSPKAPRRKVAWLVAKLYAFKPLKYVKCAKLAKLLGYKEQQYQNVAEKNHIRQRFEALLQLPLSELETHLQWALSEFKDDENLDWVKLTNDLSIWDLGPYENIREIWAKEYFNHQ